MPSAATLLQLALTGSAQDCIAQAGLPRHRVIQEALRLAADPAVAAGHPELAQRVHDHMKRSTAFRRNQGRAFSGRS